MMNNNGVFTVIYKGGRARCELNLDSIMPVSITDFRRILSMIDMSTTHPENPGAYAPEIYANELHNYICSKVSLLKRERELLSDRNKTDVKRITKINTELRKYTVMSKELNSKYDLPLLTDSDAETKFKSATVYRIAGNREKPIVNEFSGWTFQKSGYIFQVYKNPDCNGDYIVVYKGFLCGNCSTKTGAPVVINERIIDCIRKHKKDFKNEYVNILTAAGYIKPENVPEPKTPEPSPETAATEPAPAAAEPESAPENLETTPENVPETENESEAETMNPANSNRTFTPGNVTENGSVYPVKYELHDNGIIYYSYNTGRGAVYSYITPAESGYKSAWIAATSETITTVPEPTPAPGQLYNNKSFIGTTINSDGFRVYFDDTLQRTRIIFDNEPTPAERAAVENAGFYYSSVVNSWNKKLTCKAYRAALQLVKTLAALAA